MIILDTMTYTCDNFGRSGCWRLQHSWPVRLFDHQRIRPPIGFPMAGQIGNVVNLYAQLSILYERARVLRCSFLRSFLIAGYV